MSLLAVQRFHRWVISIAFIVYGITAINCIGYFHFDEHYQIIEFASLKLSLNNPSDLA